MNVARLGMSARPKIMEPAGFASSARAELALAIAARDAHASALAALDAAGTRLQDDANQAWNALGAAQKGLEAATASAAREAIAAAVAGAPGPRGAVTAARTALTVAEDEYSVARAAMSDQPERFSTMEDQARELVKRVDHAAARVLGEHPQAAELAAHTAKLQREVAVNMRALEWMRSTRVIETQTFEYLGPSIPERDRLVNGVIGKLHQHVRHWFNDIPEAPPMLLAALERLKADPNAALPDEVTK